MKKPLVFGKYLLLERINVGGMAEVFITKAFGVERFERILAIKRILPTMAEDQDFIGMFIDEARISAELTHANIIHIFDLGKHDQSFFIAMEYVAGRDVRAIQDRYRKRQQPIPLHASVYIASKMCEGLDYAHRKKDARGADLNIIHRDVSPQNILVSYEGEVKIIDFGIAKASNRSQKTEAGILKGKFGYMSPEQVRGVEIDRRSDIFAVGVLLYEMLTGERLFTGESDFSTLEKVKNAVVEPPSKLNPTIPPELERVVLKALARETEDRYQWASDLQEDLQRFLLMGDTIFTAKQLSAFMKNEFAEDVLREAERMERFSKIERPDELESSTMTGPPRRPTPARDSDSGLVPLDAPAPFADQVRTQVVSEPPAPKKSGSSPKPWATDPPAPAMQRTTSRPAVVVGSGPVYSGSTHVGGTPNPNRAVSFESNPALFRSSASETRLRPIQPDDEEPPSGEIPYQDTGRIVAPTGLQQLRPRNGVQRGSAISRSPTASDPVHLKIWDEHRWIRPAITVAVLIAVLVGAFLWFRYEHPTRFQLAVTVAPLDSSEVWVGDNKLSNPGSIELPEGDYTIRASAPGYRSWKSAVVHMGPEKPVVAIEHILEHDGNAPPPPKRQNTSSTPPPVETPAAAQKLFVAKFEATQPGIRVSLEGKSLGETPSVRADGLVIGKDYKYVARKEGYRTLHSVFHSDGATEVVIPLDLEKEVHTPRPPKPVATTEHTPSTPAATADKFGTLICSSDPAGAEIWVDDKFSGKKTPLPKAKALKLAVGQHVVVLKLDNRKSIPRTVTIEENSEESLLKVPLQ